MFRLQHYLILGLLSAAVSCSPLPTIQREEFEPSPTILDIKTTTPAPTATVIPTPSTTPTSALTFTSSPSPTHPSKQHIEVGQQALRNGNWAKAELAFREGQIHADHPEAAAEALLGLATSYLRGAKIEQAIATLNLYTQMYPHTTSLPDAYFLLGESFTAQATWPSAIQSYKHYLQLNPQVIDSYVWERIAHAHNQNGDYSLAADAFEAAISTERSGNPNLLLLDKAQALRMAGDLTGALTLYDLVNNNTNYPTTHAQMDYLRGYIALQLGETARAHQYFHNAVTNYPHAYYTYLALVELVTSEIVVDEFQRGLIDYHAAQYAPAIKAFERYLISEPLHDAQVHYYTALSYRALDDWQSAIIHFNEIIATHEQDEIWVEAWMESAYTQWAWGEQYEAAIQTYLDFVAAAQQHPKAPDALFNSARVAERQGNLSRASALWGQAADDYPSASSASRSAFLSGITFYRNNALEDAQSRFEQAYRLATDYPQQKSSALLWLGKIQHALGSQDEAIESWQAASAVDRGGYYALRAGELRGHLDPFTDLLSTNLEFPAQEDREIAETWLASRLGLEHLENFGELSEVFLRDKRWVRGLTLWRLGLEEDARTELDHLLTGNQDDALACYRLALAFRSIGYYYGTLRAASKAIDALGLTDLLYVPPFITYLLYGPYYQDLILPISKSYGLDPLLMYSVVRQESLFQSSIISAAYAQGLMQIIPPTGEWIALQLAWPDYEKAQLDLPFVNVEFGAYYLDRQRDTFPDNPYAALAAYNAGPGNADIWYQIAGTDTDLFLEVIRLEEPRRYIRRVREHYAVYRDMYEY